MRAERVAAARRAVGRLAAALGVFLAALWVAVYWVEAEKELRILCGMSTPGTPAAEVARLFGTANLSRLQELDAARDPGRPVRSTADGTTRTLRAESVRNLTRSSCTLELRDGTVWMAQHRAQFTLAMPAAAALLLGLMRLLVLEARRRVAPARARTDGDASASPMLPRVAAGLRALLLGFAALCVAQVAGWLDLAPLAAVAGDALWILTIGCIGWASWIVAAPGADRRWRRAAGAAVLALGGIVLLLDPPSAVAQTSAGVKLSDTPARLEG